VAQVLGDAFPEMRARQDHVMHLIESEEKAFAVTLDKGLGLFEDVAGTVQSEGMSVIPGNRAFDLYATFGFPRDLVELMARERGLSVDDQGWSRAEARHKEASKGAGRGYLVDPGQIEGLPPTEPLWYRGGDHDGLQGQARPLKLIDGTRLVLDRTPFYAESGGQVGDAGEVVGPGFRFRVDDTQKMGDQVIHVGELLEGRAENLPAEVEARVDGERRLRVMANHTATHLLHWALRKVLGEHASQQGSLVAADRLRFDVTHPRAITPDEIERMEALINEKIAGATPLQTTVEDLKAAKDRGVIAMFGEKYDDRVRVVDIGGYSTELCGGTHCASTGQIGAFVVVMETAVQAGVRRLEAVTRDAAIARIQEQRRLLREASHTLKVPESEVVNRIHLLQQQIKDMRKGASQKSQGDTKTLVARLLQEAESVHGALLVEGVLEGLSPKDLMAVCEGLKGADKSVCGVVGLAHEGKVNLGAFASKDLVAAGVHAGNVVKAMAEIVGGGGGGRPEFAQAGGKDVARIPDALATGAALLREALAKVSAS
jgi:alanyl-tRNA synthetase